MSNSASTGIILKKKLIILAVLALIITFAVIAGKFYWQNLRGIWPLLRPIPSTESPVVRNTDPVVKSENTTGMPLKVPVGFSISVFAKDLPNARVLVFDKLGNLWISQPSQGTVSFLKIENGEVAYKEVVFKNLKNPHGLVFDPDDSTMIYIAEENKISRAEASIGASLEKIANLPSGGGHFTRTLGFGPDKRLYVSIGSSCNVCNETDNRRAKIFSMNKDGSDFREYARGLRNSVFFTWHPITGQLWATEMGRDLLGDNIPPDEINIIEVDRNYGWPICYGKNIHDTNFDKNTYIRNPCMEPLETGSHVDLQAHSAPLGLAFVPGTWPKDYRNDLLVAFHGSWNRSAPTGYKLVRIRLDANGKYESTDDFITGWLTEGKVYGRPVDLVFGHDGALYVSDDRAGLIYKITNSN